MMFPSEKYPQRNVARGSHLNAWRLNAKAHLEPAWAGRSCAESCDDTDIMGWGDL